MCYLSLLVENNENIYYEHLVLFNTVGMVSGVTSFLSYKSCSISIKKFFCRKTFLGASLTMENLGSETKALQKRWDEKHSNVICVLQKISGSRHANVIVGELRSDCAKYQEGLDKASQSNEELHRAMEIHIANLRVLSQPLIELQKTLPSPADISRCKRLSNFTFVLLDHKINCISHWTSFDLIWSCVLLA